MDNFTEEQSERLRRRVTEKIFRSYQQALNDPDSAKVPPTKPDRLLGWSNIFWMIASIAVFYYTDFFLACRYDPRVNRIWFNIGVALLCVNICCAAYIIVWVTWIKKVSSDDWEKLHPWLFPLVTVSFLIASVCLLVGLWPVWSFFTPFILFTLFMGFVIVIASLPPWK